MQRVLRKIQDYFFERQKVNLKSLAIFTRQFSMMYRCGIGISRIFAVLSEQTLDKKLRYVIRHIYFSLLAEGETLYNSFAKFPNVFPPTYLAVIKVGEKVGGESFAALLDKLTASLERSYALRQRIYSVLTYPVFVVIAAFAVLIASAIYVFPTFIPLLMAAGQEKPFFTALLLGFIKVFSNPLYILFWLLLITFMIILIFRFIKTPAGERFFENLILSIPILTKFVIKLNIIAFCRTLSVLYKSGMPLIQSLTIVQSVMKLNSYKDYIEKAKRAMTEEGIDLGKFLIARPYFPQQLAHIIIVGQETGNMSLVLDKLADIYELEINLTLQSLSKLIEPILLLFLGGGILCILLGVFMPLYKLLEFK